MVQTFTVLQDFLIVQSSSLHVFTCSSLCGSSPPQAHAIALTVAQAFHLAKEDCEEKERKEIENRQRVSGDDL